MDFLKEWRSKMKNNLSKGLLIQLVLLIILIILMIVSIFHRAFLSYADFVAGITFFVMVFNKKKDYNKLKQIILIILGLLFISLGIFNIING